MKEKEKIQMRKQNMKLFPLYKTLGWDYLFFYTTNFLFLTQVKGIDAADVVLIDSFYALFGILMQIPATFVIEYLGRRKSLILANILNCVYMLVVMFSTNLFHLIVAELLSSLAFGIKDSAEPAILNESIPPSKYRSQIYARITQKGISNYYIINAITTVLAGFFYDVNPYIPISLALAVTIFVTLLSIGLREPQEAKKKHKVQQSNQLAQIKDSFQFILKSERLKSLILFSAIVTGVSSVLGTYEINLLEDLQVSASLLGMIFAGLGIMAGIAAKKQEKFHEHFHNRSLCTLMYITAITMILAGFFGILAKQYVIFILFIVLSFAIRYSSKGIYEPLIEKYLSNFTNHEIDTKIFTATNLIGSIVSAIIGFMASFLLENMNIAYAFSLVGVVFFITIVLMDRYMKTRVGLKPEEYPKEEVKYDELAKKDEKVESK